MESLERYRPIVDDFDAFLAACRRPLGTTVRVNTIKATLERARAVLAAEGVDHEPLPWVPDVLTLETDTPGATWASVLGFTLGQDAVSSLPVHALDPTPDECIWAACAAPGGKATHIAARQGDDGHVVANDANLGRLSALRFNAERLGVTSLSVTRHDARNYPMSQFPFDRFDRALVDAPCSCEGTIRKNSDVLEDWSLGHVESMAGIQKGILRRAVQLTRPGGRVVYSTCTFAPEENEAVVAHALETENCRVVEPPLPADLTYRAGGQSWNGDRYGEPLERTARIYPHHNDSAGFFVAALEVTGA